MATATLGILRELAKSQPVVLVVDDLPWADAPSAQALSYALRRTQSQRIGLVAAARREWLTERPTTAIDALDTHQVSRIRLEGVSPSALGELLRKGTDVPFSRSTLLSLHRRSGGNPMLALHLAGRSVPVGRPAASMPEVLQGSLATRLKELSASDRDVLLLAALCESPSASLLRAAAGSPQAAEESLRSAFRLGVLTENDGALQFTHPLLRTVIVESAPSPVRRAAHRRLADLADQPEVRLRHLALAAVGADAGGGGGRGSRQARDRTRCLPHRRRSRPAGGSAYA